MRFSPLTIKKFRRFRSIRRGYFSLIAFVVLVLWSFAAELFINSRALIVRYEGAYYFPTYGAVMPGKVFGLDYDHETNYRELKVKLSGTDNWVWLPLVPYDAYETDLTEGQYPPLAPSLETQHYLGTDTVGRDVLARLVYGFRTAIVFSLVLLFIEYLVGVSIGCMMGYYGSWFDLLMQRLIEIWSNVPFLYIVIIVASIMVPTFGSLVGIMVFFGWMHMTWYMRTATYREKAREYTAAARAVGASHTRIMFRHILPNAISILVTFIPFSISGGIVALTSLDYLGFGLPPPTPSWGEMLSQGTANMDKVWIVASVVTAMVVVLMMVTFIGEAVREAFDPKKYATYE